MNQKIKEMWTAELRSGKWKQGQGHLKAVENGEVRHCCLGVLCEIAVREGITQEFWSVDDEIVFGPSEDEARDLFLPLDVMRWAGLSGIDPATSMVAVSGGVSKVIWGDTLSKLNDDHVSFADIADTIEALI
jgi:hypothetical protein